MRYGHNTWNATRVWERLYVGSLADAETLAVNGSGITTVVTLCELPVKQRRQGVNYLHLPIEDAEPVPTRQLGCILATIGKHIRRGTVLLHCSQGMSRAPSLAAAYMDVVGCMGIDTAIREIRKLRPIIHPSPTLVNSLKENLR